MLSIQYTRQMAEKLTTATQQLELWQFTRVQNLSKNETSLWVFTTMNMTSALPEGNDSDRRPVLVVIETVFLCLIWLFGMSGNLLVCIVIYRSRRLQSTTNYFVVSLACGDILVALVCMPFILGRVIAGYWLFTPGLCKLVRVIQWLIPASSVYVMMSICIDRFYTIIYPLSFKISRTTAKNMIALSWIVAIIICVPGFYFYSITPENGVTMCATFLTSAWNSIFYIVTLVLLIFVVPVTSVIIGYSRIFKYIWTAGTTIHRTSNPVPRAKVKMIKMIMIVNASYFALLCPMLLFNLWFTISGATNAHPSVYITGVWLCFFTTVSKPATYWCYNSNFRRGCKEVFCMSTMKCYRGDAYAITTMSRFAKKNHIGKYPVNVENCLLFVNVRTLPLSE